MRVSCRGSVETTCSRRRPQSRHHHSSPRKVSQRSLGSSRLVPGEPITQVCRPFRKPPARCNLLPGARRRALQPYGPFTAFFVNCCCSVEFLTREEARDPGSTIIVTLFAVHTLLRWYRDGEDLDAKLPLLATYLGHQTPFGNAALSSSHRRTLSRDHSASRCGLW